MGGVRRHPRLRQQLRYRRMAPVAAPHERPHSVGRGAGVCCVRAPRACLFVFPPTPLALSQHTCQESEASPGSSFIFCSCLKFGKHRARLVAGRVGFDSPAAMRSVDTITASARQEARWSEHDEKPVGQPHSSTPCFAGVPAVRLHGTMHAKFSNPLPTTPGTLVFVFGLNRPTFSLHYCCQPTAQNSCRR